MSSIEDLRHSGSKDLTKSKQSLLQEMRAEYAGEEDAIVCGRFPHMNYCLCKPPCKDILQNPKSLVEVSKNIYMGPIHHAYKTKELIAAGVTHILNVSSMYYTKRNKYFKYLDIELYDLVTEDARKFFRIANRFFDYCIAQGGKILVHSVNGKSRAPTFVLAYLIGKCKKPLKDALAQLKECCPDIEPNENFLTQLREYDLEKTTKV